MLIDYLKKISLELQLVTEPEEAEQEASTQCRLDFIFGIGQDGLSPLEAALQHKGVGDSLQRDIPRDRLEDFFAHLYPALCKNLRLPADLSEDLHLNIRLAAIETPGDREIVRAIARTVSHGCGGNCDCGCC